MSQLSQSRIAVLGATSQIAKDLISGWASPEGPQLTLYARDVASVQSWLAEQQFPRPLDVFDYAAFGQHDHDVLLNFVGIGDPARAVQMGGEIFDVTLRFDQMALDYLDGHPACRYLFLSSGAAYGNSFLTPVDETSQAVFPINQLMAQDYYSVAKMHAECRHRARPSDAIIDIRVFNYFSHTQNMAARFFITDIMRAIREGQTLNTTDQPMVRDFTHPSDFRHLLECLITAPKANAAVDCYSLAPIDKVGLLEAMQRQFGLKYQVATSAAAVNATGAKPNYYSKNHRAADFGYQPKMSSLDAIIAEAKLVLA